MVKNVPAILETCVLSLGQEDPLEKGMATHSSILAWRFPWTEEPGRLQSMGSQKSQTYINNIIYGKVVKRVNSKSSHQKENFFFNFIMSI